VQNHGRQAAIVARVAEVRGRFGSLARAKSDRSWRGFVGSIAQIVKEMPLWKLQTLRRRNVPFLYEKSSGPRITLLPGVAFNLRRFGALIQLLARSAWVQHIRSNPRNAPTVGGATDLELFLFGGARVDLSAARAALQEIQENRCFYCGSAMSRANLYVETNSPSSKIRCTCCRKSSWPRSPGGAVIRPCRSNSRPSPE